MPVQRAGAVATAPDALEQLLERLQREQLTALDLRILRLLAGHELTIAEIAQALAQPPSTIRRASARLVARGLLRRNRRGRPLKLTLDATERGTSALHRVRGTLADEPGSAAIDDLEARIGRRVVVGYDGSDAAKRALRQGAVAAGPGGSLIVVSVRHRAPGRGLNPEPFVEASREPAHVLDEARSLVADSTTADIKSVPREGNPAVEIVDVARSHDADLIMIGRSSGRFMARAIFGSVATRIVELADCDVFVVA
jgi:nucleotide-binding universal stress UspA family protein/DNA-binding MarR family transcriptional regulator